MYLCVHVCVQLRVWAGEENYKTQFQLSHGQCCHPLHQAAQGPIQPGLEHLQGWDIYGFSEPHHLEEAKLLFGDSEILFPVSK